LDLLVNEALETSQSLELVLNTTGVIDMQLIQATAGVLPLGEDIQKN
jgi:hypothetical protein